MNDQTTCAPSPVAAATREAARQERRMLGAQAVGALRGLLVAGVLNNFPRNAELCTEICTKWDAAMSDDHE